MRTKDASTKSTTFTTWKGGLALILMSLCLIATTVGMLEWGMLHGKSEALVPIGAHQ